MTTNCVLPPELDDKQLLSHLDDPDANQNIAQHLENCPYCRERAENLDRFQKRLSSRLHRATCPSPMELGEFHLHMLPASQMLLIGGHLRACKYCQQEIEQLEGYLSDASRSGILDRVKRFTAELVSTRSGTPGFAGLRGEDEEPLRYRADDIPIILGVREDQQHPGSKMLSGLIPGMSLRGFTVEIYQGEKLLTSTTVDDVSSFLFAPLAPGLYDLVLPSHGVEVRIESVIV